MSSDRVILRRIAHIHYRHKSLQRTGVFLRDFGFIPVPQAAPSSNGGKSLEYYRGYGNLPFIYVAEQAASDEEPAFVRVAFEADSEADFTKATKVKGASQVRALNAPGGGQTVSLYDPNGTQIDIVYGQELVEPQPPQQVTQPINAGLPDNEAKPRPAGSFQRFDPKATVQVHKLGHLVLQVPQYDVVRAWYQEVLNFVPSDELMLEQGIEVGAFLHLDLAERPTDHHTLFLQRLPPDAPQQVRIHHSAYELHSIDHEFLAHQSLRNKGYELAWGVGRHILGSQLFDYWHQADDSFNIEHYADGDLVNADTPIGRHIVGPGRPQEEHLSVWGSKFGEHFASTGNVLSELAASQS